LSARSSSLISVSNLALSFFLNLASFLSLASSALERGKIYYQKDGWVDKLLGKVKLTAEIKDKIIKHYSDKISRDLKLLQKSSSRNDFLQFIKYLHKVIRNLQIIYLLKNSKPVVSEKFFNKRFAKIENGEITKLISSVSTQIDMNSIYKNIR
ncbi:hypothetical protein KKA49_03965, partial [Patescibacteria group bacterium]|nr:hypothetical protein [Patescibacteria group bacterium]MBU1457647.1 hypothetical protein [Patescibacteria group bacterium]